LAIDPRGWGESAPDKGNSGYSGVWQLAQRAMLIGRPLTGMQVYDVLRAFDYLRARPEVDAGRITVRGDGKGGILALYAGALEPSIAGVESNGSLASYMTLARAVKHASAIDVVVPGVLQDFDLPDVAALVAPRPLRIASARDANGAPLELARVQREYAPAVQRYKRAKRADALEISGDAR
jgi:fermentation-respiration switch protein FrsA (DUF1100 family)